MTNTELLLRFRWQIVFLLVGAALAGAGVFLTLNKTEKPEFEIIEANEPENATLTVEVSGAVSSAGVYSLPGGSRVEDAIKMAGGISSEADLSWMEKYLNRAAYVTDGQKIYIPSHSEEGSDSNPGGYQTTSEVLAGVSTGFVNINTASQSELEELQGIGPVYAQKIIDNRPYSNPEELVSKKVITQKIYDQNKDLLSIY